MTTYNAPPVVYPLRRYGVHTWVLAGLWCIGLLAILFWLFASPGESWRIGLALCFLCFSCFAACTGAKNAPVGTLAWDGQTWRWESDGYETGISEQKLFLLADFQKVIFLRIENRAKESMWLSVEKEVFSERWHDFRRAVYCAQHGLEDTAKFSQQRTRKP